MRKLPTIAVVIPNRNDSAYLAKCLESVILQSIKVDQIIFVDDCSDDDSISKARFILSNIDNVKIISSQSNLGTMGVLNLGLKFVVTDYVFFLSSNDYLLPKMVEIAKLSISKFNNPGIWSALVWSADENGRCNYIYPSPIISFKEKYFHSSQCVDLAIKFGNWFTGPTMIFHKKTLEDIGGFKIFYKGLADLFSALKVSTLNGAIFYPRPLGVMRMHSGGYLASTLKDEVQLENILFNLSIESTIVSSDIRSSKFFNRLKHRLRFSFLRASGFSNNLTLNNGWNERRYIILLFIFKFFGKNELLKSMLAFLVIRPFDIFSTIIYRFCFYFFLKLSLKFIKDVELD